VRRWYTGWAASPPRLLKICASIKHCAHALSHTRTRKQPNTHAPRSYQIRALRIFTDTKRERETHTDTCTREHPHTQMEFSLPCLRAHAVCSLSFFLSSAHALSLTVTLPPTQTQTNTDKHGHYAHTHTHTRTHTQPPPTHTIMPTRTAPCNLTTGNMHRQGRLNSIVWLEGLALRVKELAAQQMLSAEEADNEAALSRQSPDVCLQCGRLSCSCLAVGVCVCVCVCV